MLNKISDSDSNSFLTSSYIIKLIGTDMTLESVVP